MRIRRLAVLMIAAMLALPVAASAQEQQQPKLNRKGGDWPKDPRALKLVERELELGRLGPLAVGLPATPRYLVTYMLSDTSSAIRSATVVTITNQSGSNCEVSVSYFKGFSDNSSPVCSTSFGIPPDFTVDFCSRNLPTFLTVCNSICSPELTFDEGRAIVSSTCREIGVSSRVYYTGSEDREVFAITDSNIVVFGAGNTGD